MHRGAAENLRSRGPWQAGQRYASVHLLVLFIYNEHRWKVNFCLQGKNREVDENGASRDRNRTPGNSRREIGELAYLRPAGGDFTEN